MRYLFTVFNVFEIYLLLVLAANLQFGSAGLVTVTTFAFAGAGAYTTIILYQIYQFNFLASLLLGVIMSASISYILSPLLLRTRSLYFVISGLTIHYVLLTIFENWISLTGGANGIKDIPRPLNLFNVAAYDNLFLSSILAIPLFILMYMLLRSDFSLILRCIREDEIGSEAAGVNIRLFKRLALIISSMLAAVAGSLLVLHLSLINPNIFSLHESIFLLAGVVIGGRGTLLASFVGATYLILIPEILSFIPVDDLPFIISPSEFVGQGKQILFGLTMIAFLMMGRQGLIPERLILGRLYGRSKICRSS